MIFKSDREEIEGSNHATARSKELKYVVNIDVANNNGTFVNSPHGVFNIDAGQSDKDGKNIFVNRVGFRFEQVNIPSTELKNGRSICVSNNRGIFILSLRGEFNFFGGQPDENAKVALRNRSEFCLEDVVNSSKERREIALNINVTNNGGVFIVSSHGQFNFVDCQSEKNVEDGVNNRSEFCFGDGVNFSEKRSEDIFNINVANNDGNVIISQYASLNLVYGGQSVEGAISNRSEFCLGHVVISNAIPSQL